MFKTKRKRAVVLALIAFFCTAATSYVAVDWKRLGGGFLAYFKGNGGPVFASRGGSSLGTGAGRGIQDADAHPHSSPLTRLAAGTRRHADSGGHKSDEDLFKYGDPAAGGIAPGSFVVAQNDTPHSGGGPASPEIVSAAPSGGEAVIGSVSSPAPFPGGTAGVGGGIIGGRTPPAPPAATPPAATPPAAATPPSPPPPSEAPAPAPTQSGTTDDPGNGDPTGGTPIASPPPVSAVPEASDLEMMGLGALFLAVAATRRRKNG